MAIPIWLPLSNTVYQRPERNYYRWPKCERKCEFPGFDKGGLTLDDASLGQQPLEVIGLLAPEASILPSTFLALRIWMGTVDDLTEI